MIGRMKRIPMSLKPVLVLTILGLVYTEPHGSADAVDIFNLGVLPGGTSANSFGISGDGSTVVGNSGSSDGLRAFRWRSGSGMENLGVLPGGTDSRGRATNFDGSVVVGFSINWDENDWQAIRWTADGGMEKLGGLNGTYSDAFGVSADGSVVVGESDAVASGAFRWTAGGGVQDLGALEGGGSSARGVSADGSVMAGYSFDQDFNSHAIRWTSGGGMQDLGLLSDGTFSAANSISADGTTIVGFGDVNGISRAFRWTAEDGMVSIGGLFADGFTEARAVNADGSVVVGSSYTEAGTRAFLWQSSIGMVDLNTYLPMLGLDLTGWVLENTMGISADGTSITGWGKYNGANTSFLVTGVVVPEPSTVVMGLCSVTAIGFLAVRNRKSGGRKVR